MSTVRRIAKNTIVMLTGDIIGKVLTFIFVVYAARYLQAEGFGILSFALAFTSMFGIFSDIGFYELIVREVARDEKSAGSYTGNVAVLKAIFVSAMYGLMCLTINIMGYSQQTVMVVYILGLSIVFDAFTMVFNATFQAFEKMEYISTGKILRNAILVLGISLIMFEGLELMSFAWLYLVASFITLVYSAAILIKKFTRPRFDVDLFFLKWLLKEGASFWATGVFTILLNNIDKVMLSAMVSNIAVGIYSAAFGLMFALTFIPIAFIASIFPVTSRLFVSSKRSLRFAFERSFKYLLITGVLIAILITILSDKLILFIYGEEYLPSSNVLKILIWSEVFLFVNMVFGNLFKSINRQILVTYTVAMAVVLNVTMNWILIPKYSFIGASFATLIARSFTFAVFFILVMRSEYRLSNESLTTIAKVVFAFLVVGGFVWTLGEFDSVLVAILSVFTYTIAIFALRLIDDTDIQLMKHLIKGY